VTDPTPGRPVLVIGYGSELRRDDAAGRHAAEQVATRGLAGVRVLSVTQLAPEHAADIADSRLVVFVDASIVDDAVSVRSVVPAWPDWRLTHHLTPAALLGLAQAVGDRIPEGVIVTIPITDAALGLSLSARAAAGVREAVERIVELCAGPARRPDERSRRRTAEG
jgi:hydrogenase maturation protease